MCDHPHQTRAHFSLARHLVAPNLPATTTAAAVVGARLSEEEPPLPLALVHAPPPHGPPLGRATNARRSEEEGPRARCSEEELSLGHIVGPPSSTRRHCCSCSTSPKRIPPPPRSSAAGDVPHPYTTCPMVWICRRLLWLRTPKFVGDYLGLG
jgi:hypothetical protein